MENRYTILVAGNPDFSYYNRNNNKEKHILFRYENADNVKKTYENLYRTVLENDKVYGDSVSEKIHRNFLEYIEGMDNDELWEYIGQYYDIDDETKDVYIYTNPYGVWDKIVDATFETAMPLVTKEGKKVLECKLSDIDWEASNENEKRPMLERTWEIVVEGKKPKTKEDHKIAKNKKKLVNINKVFKSKEDYVDANSMFFCNAFLSENKIGVFDGSMECIKPIGEWCRTFKERFIDNLPPDTNIKIYNYIIDDEK